MGNCLRGGPQHFQAHAFGPRFVTCSAQVQYVSRPSSARVLAGEGRFCVNRNRSDRYRVATYDAHARCPRCALSQAPEILHQHARGVRAVSRYEYRADWWPKTSSGRSLMWYRQSGTRQTPSRRTECALDVDITGAGDSATAHGSPASGANNYDTDISCSELRLAPILVEMSSCARWCTWDLV
jgi:hypothetical protein